MPCFTFAVSDIYFDSYSRLKINATFFFSTYTFCSFVITEQLFGKNAARVKLVMSPLQMCGETLETLVLLVQMSARMK